MLADVDLRSPTPDPSEPTPRPDLPADPAEPVAWRVDRRLTIAKWTGAVVFALAAAVGYPDVGQLGLAGLAAAVLAGLAVRDLVAPVRLAADPAGVTVRPGFTASRRLSWDQVERIRVDARKGLVVRSQVLELDAGNDLFFFSVNELGAPCEDVAERLRWFRSHSVR